MACVLQGENAAAPDAASRHSRLSSADFRALAKVGYELNAAPRAAGYVSAPTSPRAHAAAVSRAARLWGSVSEGEEESDDEDWGRADAAWPLLPLGFRRRRPSSTPQVRGSGH